MDADTVPGPCCVITAPGVHAPQRDSGLVAHAHELHYRGFAGVPEEREWDPELLGLRGELERCCLDTTRGSAAHPP